MAIIISSSLWEEKNAHALEAKKKYKIKLKKEKRIRKIETKKPYAVGWFDIDAVVHQRFKSIR